MGVNLNSYAVNQISKGTEIFSENESIANACLVLKGRVLVQNYGFKTIVGSGSFIGITDLYMGRFVNSYTAFDDVTLFAFDATKPADIEPILLGNKDYSGLLVAVLARNVVEAEKIYSELDTSVRNIYEYLSKSYEDFKEIAAKVGFRINTIESLESLEPFPSEQVLNEKKLSYYLGLAKIPLDVQKPFFSYDTTITMRHVEEMAGILTTYSLESMERSSYLAQLLDNIINETKDCFFNQMIHMAIEIHKLGKKNIELDTMVDKLIDTINSAEKLITSKTARSIHVNRERMERLYTSLLTGEEVADEKHVEVSNNSRADIDADKAIVELKDSLNKILEYAGISQDESNEFKNQMAEFKKMSDKFDTSDEARVIRRGIMRMFYPLYQTVFMRAYKEKSNDKVIDLFLRYAFLDETLLTKEQLIELYYLPEQLDNSIPCKVYNIKDWLVEIYEGRKEPSKSEFDLDFTEDFREKRKSMHMTPQEEKAYLEDPMRKLNYEIINMFQYNNRLVNGQVATFVPILHSDIFVKGLNSTFVTAAKVNYTVNQLREIDYSIFYRETLYFDRAKKIEKE
ncbi:MAG TPA: hypothetical protein VHQ24_03705, partial [Lachnospiraceae bacterium]|nr:hypothetical protein [Lachnospiraceae bacterium]